MAYVTTVHKRDLEIVYKEYGTCWMVSINYSTSVTSYRMLNMNMNMNMNIKVNTILCLLLMLVLKTKKCEIKQR